MYSDLMFHRNISLPLPLGKEKESVDINYPRSGKLKTFCFMCMYTTCTSHTVPPSGTSQPPIFLLRTSELFWVHLRTLVLSTMAEEQQSSRLSLYLKESQRKVRNSFPLLKIRLKILFSSFKRWWFVKRTDNLLCTFLSMQAFFPRNLLQDYFSRTQSLI